MWVLWTRLLVGTRGGSSRNGVIVRTVCRENEFLPVMLECIDFWRYYSFQLCILNKLLLIVYGAFVIMHMVRAEVHTASTTRRFWHE